MKPALYYIFFRIGDPDVRYRMNPTSSPDHYPVRSEMKIPPGKVVEAYVLALRTAGRTSRS